MLTEVDFHIRNGKTKETYSWTADHPESPWWPVWLGTLLAVIQRRGGNIEVASNLHEWVSTHDSFEDVVCQEHFFPASPWMQGDDPESIRERRIGEQAREDVIVPPFVLCGVTFLIDICLYRR
jgi:hypothetical protein